MGSNMSSSESLPHDIRTELRKHDAVLRLSYVEIVSGINRLLRQGIPKEVISEVVMRAVEAVSKDFNPRPDQKFCSQIESEPDGPEQ
jgi:hypothetical protein